MGVREIIFILLVYGAYRYVVAPLLQAAERGRNRPIPTQTPPSKTTASSKKTNDEGEYIEYEELK